MKTFLIFKHPDNRLEAVKSGFSFPGALGGGLWLLWHRMWLHGSIALVAGLGVYALFPSPEGYIYGIPYGHRFGIADILNVVICAIVGFLGNDWRASSLLDRGFENVGSELAETPDGAKGAYLRRVANGGDNEPLFMRREPF